VVRVGWNFDDALIKSREGKEGRERRRVSDLTRGWGEVGSRLATAKRRCYCTQARCKVEANADISCVLWTKHDE
jgi:hypothetical protein